MNKDELYRDNLRDAHWLGEVVVNEDPLLKGRCRVKVFGKFDQLTDDAIPWATPMNRDAVGSHHVPRVGDIVAIRFDNGNIYHPEYWFQVDQNDDLKRDVLEASDAPHNVISLVYDAERNVRIYYSPEDGLVMTTGNNKDSQPMVRFAADGKIFLNSDSIYIASSKDDTSQPAVRGQVLHDILDSIINDLKSHVHPSSGAPMLPSTAVNLSITQKRLESIKQTK